MIQKLRELKEVIPKDLPSFLGRVQFAEGQLMGRAGRLAMADLRKIGLQSDELQPLGLPHLQALDVLIERYEANRPRVIDLAPGGSRSDLH